MTPQTRLDEQRRPCQSRWHVKREQQRSATQEEPKVLDGDNNNKTPPNALGGLRRRVRLSTRDRTTGGHCVGMLRCRAAEERVN